MRIIFFGTPEFGVSVFERLIDSDYRPILVVTTPDMPTGRKQTLTPPPVKQLAQTHKIPILQPERLEKFTTLLNQESRIKNQEIDLIIVAAYGKVIPKEILAIPKHGALNVHPSLLPRWRGPSPIQYAILNGDTETGVTIMLMDEELDHGPILSNFIFQISDFRFTTEELTNKLAELGANLLLETIPKWITGEIKPKEQDHKKATYSKIITKEDGHIDWLKSAEEIERQIRAFTPWPGSFSFWDTMRIRITKGIIDSTPQSKPRTSGQIFLNNENQLSVQTGEEIFRIEKLQPDGKNEMTSKQFFNGHPDIIGVLLK